MGGGVGVRMMGLGVAMAGRVGGGVVSKGGVGGGWGGGCRAGRQSPLRRVPGPRRRRPAREPAAVFRAQ